ncbi:ATP-binding protein [uncultured Selenomonas sp.]|uniref:ATP-binding protein n=1 Tax=uncultured Selenomonas sp. TaxID=159275 RepID=UPI00267748F0|nr:ATP-binding protein [uncultured Selenomonas sp.]
MAPQVNLSSLLTLHNLRMDPVLAALEDAMMYGDEGEEERSECCAALITAAENLGLRGNLLPHYLLHSITHTPNIVSETMERTGLPPGNSLRHIFHQDIALLYPIFTLPTSAFLRTEALDDYEPTKNVYDKTEDFILPLLDAAKTTEDYAEALLTFYARYGCGDIASYSVFRWDSAVHHICGVDYFERPRMKDIIGYQHQKELLIRNTRAFVLGKPSNHVLLVGARGTGKSSAVKALVSEYEDSIRLVQVTKDQLRDLPAIMNELRRYAGRKFIIFLDDLSFEDSDTEFKAVKSAIEGSVSSCPSNVRIYATSNRRHLIRETWREREQDEVYRGDSINETISLSDRFGLIIQYHTPDQEEYLAIIDHMLTQKGIHLTPEELRIAGLRWEMTHSGRSGRTAQQFVAYYLGNNE